MTISDFTMLSVAHIPVTHPATLPIAVMQELQSDIGAISVTNDGKLSCQSSPFGEVIATTEQLKQSCYNFDTNWGQINVENLKLLSLSLSSESDPYENPKIVQTFLAQCNKRTTFKYSSKQAELQTLLSFYNAGNFKNGFTNAYVQNIVSHIGRTTPTLGKEGSQDSMQLQTREPEQMTNTEPFPVFPEELAAVFTHKDSGIRDAFTAEGAFSLGRQQE